MRTKYTKAEFMQDIRELTSPFERKEQNNGQKQGGVAERNKAIQQALSRLRAGGIPIIPGKE